MNSEEVAVRIWYQIQSLPRERIWSPIECKAAEQITKQGHFDTRVYIRYQLLGDPTQDAQTIRRQVRSVSEDHDG
jgi:hypothetical protein